MNSRLIRRLRIYLIIMLVVFAAIGVEVLAGRFGIPFVLIGVLIGLVIGITVSRSYRLSWGVETNKVISHIDWIGAALLVCYLVFIFTKSYFLGFYVQGAALFAIILGITAATMLGRILGTRHGMNKLLKTLEI
jgi:Kef-type K+ transport system membrane component KefB